VGKATEVAASMLVVSCDQSTGSHGMGILSIPAACVCAVDADTTDALSPALEGKEGIECRSGAGGG
jgi:hypothetical protein